MKAIVLPCYKEFAELNLDLIDKRGRTALHLCALKNDKVGLKRLLAEGANKEIKDVNGNFPHQLATDASLVVELGGKIESLKRKIPPKKTTLAKVIRINPKKILVNSNVPQAPNSEKPVPQAYLEDTTIPKAPQYKKFLKNAPSTVQVGQNTAMKINRKLTNLKAPATVDAPVKKEKQISALVLPQDKKIEERRSDDSDSDSERYFLTNCISSDIFKTCANSKSAPIQIKLENA